MGSSAEMEQLVQGLRSAYHERVAGVMDIRSATRHELAEFRTMRGAVTAQQRQWRTEYVDDLRQDVDELRKVTQTFLQETDAAQQMTASSQRRALIDGRDKLRQTTQALLGELGAAQEAMSAAQCQRLSEHTKQLRKVTQATLQEMDAAQQMTASSQRRALIDGRDKLRQTTQALLGELGAAQEAMSAAQRQRLSEHTKQLRKVTQAFLQEMDAAQQMTASSQRRALIDGRASLSAQVNMLRSRFRADQAKARSLWNGLVAPAGEPRAPLREAVAPAPAAPEPPPPAVSVTTAEPVVAVPEGESVEQSLDDLTVIPGIGPAMRGRLRRAGIDTYAQLASSTPEFLRQSLGEIGQLAKVDEWIAEAHRLIGAS